VLIGGVVFPIFGGLYYWIPKMTGRMMDERLGQVNFWLMFAGHNIAFFPLHILGLLGMQRRVYTYPADAGFSDLNMISTVGAFLMGIGVAVFVLNFVKSMVSGEVAGDNPWHAGTLEWATASPPEPYNFRRIPVVHSEEPLWDDPARRGWDARLAEPPERHHQVYATHVLEPEPDMLLDMPGDSYLPLAVALSMAVVFVGILLNRMPLIALGGGMGLLVAAWWMWPAEETP
jgi:heme/copper-type cytochrome/quinol oxidase subunit 1